MNTTMKIYGLSLLLIFNIVSAENIRIPIESGPNGTVTVDTNISNDETEHRMNSVGSSFSSTSGSRANATVNIKRGDGTINYTHKNSNGAVTFDTNISSDGIRPQMNLLGGGFSSTSGHRANAIVNIKKGDGTINYTHKISDGTVTFDTNISSNVTGPQINSVGGGFSGINGHGVSATVNAVGNGGTINYTHTNNRTKFKFSSGVSVNNGNRGANIGIQIPFGIK
ncbi:hypothetical protein [Nitrosomonas sp. Nm33]|uniref:hypothetical protein n=1 Tax=Nitrosomonas sp. Nm33 TaxID=133724 RepID=UPI0008953EBB|nr:hypothetical protein [Nitrosomonas sp. Nm33]SDY71571.1 hypothetical protein SAMN05421755_10423 [Nitrosomonas sp. Nm33]